MACSLRRWLLVLVVCSVAILVACGDDDPTPYVPPDGGGEDGGAGGDGGGADDAGAGTSGVGDPCQQSADCRDGLVCGVAGTCEPSGTVTEGEACVLTGDCADGLYCGPRRTCAPAGEGAEGARCTATGQCEAGLLCTLEGFAAYCRSAGSGDLGDGCSAAVECLAGLACLPVPGGDELACAEPPAVDGDVAPPALPSWSGADCGSDVGSAVAYFDVPRVAGSDTDFYRLPFPNDIRRTATGLDLGNHPTPQTAVPIDVIGRYVEASEEDLQGFATNPVVFFRFSRPHDWSSAEGALRIVNVDPDSPDFGVDHYSMAWLNTFGAISKYICPNWLAVRTGHGAPLQPGTTYAAVLTTDIVPDEGGTFERAADFEVMLDETRPGGDALGGAWEAYAPLRQWLTDSETDSATILNAAVFTTQEPEAVVPALRDVIRAGDEPPATDLTVCDEGIVSPCELPGDEVRRCQAADGSHAEIHGRIELPIFQAGTPPYLTPEDGGGIELDADGVPQVVRTESVCFALTIPTATPMPADGWPLLLHAHGTGGSFRGAVLNQLAAELSDDMSGTSVAAATLGIDLPQHGERRGDSGEDPEHLFYNFANPRAARDNVMQGAADLLSLVYWAENVSFDDASAPTGEEIRFDASRIVLFAHSQGATHASLMVPYEPGVGAVVLSGNGGDLTQSLLHKTAPVDIAGILPFALLDPNSDGRLSTGDFHPGLALFQAYFERVDPVNYAGRLHRDPLEGDTGRHVFMTYGLGDSFSPEPTLQAYARAGRFMVVEPLLTDESFGLPTAAAPLSANRAVGGRTLTIGMRQYDPEPAGVDGHFVSTRTPEGRADTLRFLRQGLAGEIPTIGE